LGGIAFAGALALILGDGRSASAVHITRGWSVPVGGVLVFVCGVIALAGFPLDDIWHRLFGQDVTAWGPTHIQMIGGASLSTLGMWALAVEGRREAAIRGRPVAGPGAWVADVGAGGGFLVGMFTLQVEFDLGVPPFRPPPPPV